MRWLGYNYGCGYGYHEKTTDYEQHIFFHKKMADYNWTRAEQKNVNEALINKDNQFCWIIWCTHQQSVLQTKKIAWLKNQVISSILLKAHYCKKKVIFQNISLYQLARSLSAAEKLKCKQFIFKKRCTCTHEWWFSIFNYK